MARKPVRLWAQADGVVNLGGISHRQGRGKLDTIGWRWARAVGRAGARGEGQWCTRDRAVAEEAARRLGLPILPAQPAEYTQGDTMNQPPLTLSTNRAPERYVRRPNGDTRVDLGFEADCDAWEDMTSHMIIRTTAGHDMNAETPAASTFRLLAGEECVAEGLIVSNGDIVLYWHASETGVARAGLEVLDSYRTLRARAQWSSLQIVFPGQTIRYGGKELLMPDGPITLPEGRVSVIEQDDRAWTLFEFVTEPSERAKAAMTAIGMWHEKTFCLTRFTWAGHGNGWTRKNLLAHLNKEPEDGKPA